MESSGLLRAGGLSERAVGRWRSLVSGFSLLGRELVEVDVQPCAPQTTPKPSTHTPEARTECVRVSDFVSTATTGCDLSDTRGSRSKQQRKRRRSWPGRQRSMTGTLGRGEGEACSGRAQCALPHACMGPMGPMCAQYALQHFFGSKPPGALELRSAWCASGCESQVVAVKCMQPSSQPGCQDCEGCAERAGCSCSCRVVLGWCSVRW